MKDTLLLKNGKIIFALVQHNTNGIIRLVGSDGLYVLWTTDQQPSLFTASHCLCSYTKILKLPSIAIEYEYCLISILCSRHDYTHVYYATIIHYNYISIIIIVTIMHHTELINE